MSAGNRPAGVVIGGGLAGGEAVEQVRGCGHDGPLVLVSQTELSGRLNADGLPGRRLARAMAAARGNAWS